MKEIICTNQSEFDAVPVDFDGRVIIKFGTPDNRAIVNRRFKRSVVAWENSSVEAWENSSVEAWENSSVEAWENSSVVARGNSSVEAWGNSSVVARENSSVVARENSSVEAWGNTQVVDATRKGNIRTNNNARTVYNPTNIEEYIEFHGLEAAENTVKLYKAVHFRNGEYCADWCYFIYKIGDMAVPDGFCEDLLNSCGAGIHLTHMNWALGYGQAWDDLAILELECEKADILVPTFSDGKVRARKAKVVREVPLEECGLYGKILAKRRASHE